jgi:hypothetical protein
VLLVASVGWWPCVGLLAVEPAADAAGAAVAAPPRPAPRPDRHPELKRLSQTEEVWVDKARKEVVVGGRVVLDRGPIEVFACLEKTKEHEALVATRSTARLVHAALLAIGLDPGSPVSFDPEYVAAKGPKVRVRLRWKDADGKQREARAQDWIRNAQTGKPLEADWVFAGSSFWRDPNDGVEYYEDLLFEAFEGRVPPSGTEVDVVLSAIRE